MYASYESIAGWLRKTEAAGTLTVLTVDLACVFGINKNTIAGLAKRGEFGPFGRDAGRFYRVQISGVRAFLEKYKCAFMNWVSLKEACRLSGAKASTLILWLNSGVIVGDRDMHGRIHLDPASLSAAREDCRWTSLPEELTLQGVTHYSLAHLARGLAARSGAEPNGKSFEQEFRRNYTMFYRWMTQTSLRQQVKRVGRRRALYIPWHIHQELVNVVRPHEAAAILGQTSYMVHYWARKGRLGVVQFAGTQRMIPREDLQAFLEYRRAAPRKPAGPRLPDHRLSPSREGCQPAQTGSAGLTLLGRPNADAAAR
jgi:excisionase family DNA binding protein